MIPPACSVPVRMLFGDKLDGRSQQLWGAREIWKPIVGVKIAGGVNGDEEKVGVVGMERAGGRLKQSLVNGDLQRGGGR